MIQDLREWLTEVERLGELVRAFKSQRPDGAAPPTRR